MVGFLGFLPQYGSAKGFEWEMSPKYVGEVHAGYRTTTSIKGVDTYSGLVDLGTLQGVSFNEYLDISLGIDGKMFTHYYSGKGMRFGMATYADIRPGYPITDDFKVFLDLGLGYFFSVSATPSLGNCFYCQCGPGVQYKKFNVSLGIQNLGTGSGSTAFFTKLGFYFKTR